MVSHGSNSNITRITLTPLSDPLQLNCVDLFPIKNKQNHLVICRNKDGTRGHVE